MLQVTIPLPERMPNGAKLDTSIINKIESGLLNSVDSFAIMHGSEQANGVRTAIKFYVLDIEPEQLNGLKSAVYTAKRELKLKFIKIGVTELNTITIN
jgi:hypothetical protein